MFRFIFFVFADKADGYVKTVIESELICIAVPVVSFSCQDIDVFLTHQHVQLEEEVEYYDKEDK